MHVVFLSRRYWPAIGGVERHLQFLSDAVQKMHSDIQITIVTEQHDASLPTLEEQKKITIHRIPISSNLKKSIWSWMTAHRSLFEKADLLHVHDVFFWMFPLMGSWNLPKIFTTFHGYEPPGPPNKKQRNQHQLAEILSDGNMCVGGFHQKWYGVQPTITTFGAVDEKFLSVKKQTKAKQGSFLFVGRLDDDTGIWSYVQAFAKLDKQKKYQLHIVGDGPLRQQLEWFVEQENLTVNFLGQQTVTPNLYQKYSCTVVSGYLTMLESLAVGVPVIATYETPLKKDYLEMSPFAEYIPIAQPGSELVHLMENSPQISTEAQQWAQQQTWDKLALQYLKIWGQT
jgi:glycosyltransferase involved in cell wall biosynthesis